MIFNMRGSNRYQSFLRSLVFKKRVKTLFNFRFYLFEYTYEKHRQAIKWHVVFYSKQLRKKMEGKKRKKEICEETDRKTKIKLDW